MDKQKRPLDVHMYTVGSLSFVLHQKSFIIFSRTKQICAVFAILKRIHDKTTVHIIAFIAATFYGFSILVKMFTIT